LNRYLDIRSYLFKVGFAFRALESRNFRLFFYSGMVSLMGTWIQNLAIGWMVYKLTESAFYLGLVGFAGQIPALVLTPIAGVFADRTNRRRVLVITQTVTMVLAFLLSALSFTGHITIVYLLVIVVLNGTAIAFDTPYRHAFLLEMVGDRKLLSNAVALNSTLVNTARFIGPTVGGFLIALFGEAYCFLINGVSFVGVIIALMMMKVPAFIKPQQRKSIYKELKEGICYAWDFLPTRYLISLVVVMSLFGLPFQSLMPVFAGDILKGDSQLLGFLTGAVGAGALTGAFFLASKNNVGGIPNIIRISAILFGVSLFAFSFSTHIWLSLVLLYFTGFGMIVQFAATNTLLQTMVSEDKRGRVLSFYSMSFLGFTPLGSLLLGSVSGLIGVPYTIAIAAVLCLMTALLFARKTVFIRQQLEDNLA
jgi:MFS family permease